MDKQNIFNYYHELMNLSISLYAQQNFLQQLKAVLPEEATSLARELFFTKKAFQQFLQHLKNKAKGEKSIFVLSDRCYLAIEEVMKQTKETVLFQFKGEKFMEMTNVYAGVSAYVHSLKAEKEVSNG